MSAIHSLDEEIEEISKNFYGIWCNPINKSYVSRDFLRLANKFILSVRNPDGDLVEDKSLFAPEVDYGHIVKVLNKISTHVDPKNKQKVVTEEDIKKEVHSLQEHESFGDFLSSFYTEDSNVVKVLKCCSQTYIVLFLGALGVHLFQACQVRAKDMRGFWNVIVERDEKDGSLSVTHRRTEQAVRQSGKMKLDNIFRFTWDVVMKFNKGPKITHFTSVEAHLIDIEWEGGVEDEELETIFLSVFGDPKITDLTIQQLTEKDDDEDQEEEEENSKKKKKKSKKKGMLGFQKKGKKKGGKKKGGKKKGWLKGFMNRSLSDVGSGFEFSEFGSIFEIKKEKKQK